MDVGFRQEQQQMDPGVRRDDVWIPAFAGMT